MTSNEQYKHNRILIIDDNPDIHADYSIILSPKSSSSQLDELEVEVFGKAAPEWTRPSFELQFAFQGDKGVDIIRQESKKGTPIQLVFVDMRMPPGWDGLKTIIEIWKVDPRVQVVLCTAYSDYSWEEINRELEHSENLLILKKPFDTSEVTQLATTLTKKWSLAREAEIQLNTLDALVAKKTRTLDTTNNMLRKEIAERKQLEAELIKSQKMEAIGTLAAGVAHDLNNILSGIVSYPDLLLTKIGKEDSLYGPLTTIRNSGIKAAAIVQDLLTLSRKSPIVQEVVDMKAVVETFLSSPTFENITHSYPNITISTDCSSEIPMVLGSPIHLEKMMLNLILNAAEAMPQGGKISINIYRQDLQEPLPDYSTITPGPHVVTTITDKGKGIHKDMLQHIFDPFFTKKKMGRSGTGLDMTIVWNTVDDHNGYIEVQSELEIGTEVKVYLPATDSSQQPSLQTTLIKNLHGTGEKILVVDDMEEQREIATAILQSLGYNVHSVPSGESALDYLQKHKVDLLLLDMIMEPGIDGLDTLQHVLQNNPKQKTAIACGYAENARVEKAQRLGAIFISKPYRLEQIAKLVKKCLSAK